MTTTFTKNLRIPKTDFLTEPWQAVVNSAFDAIDSLIFGGLVANNVAPWANSTAYTVGVVRTDISTGTLWLCISAHTSAATPTTFAADRAGAAAGKWQSVSLSMSVKGQWLQSTSYNLNDIVFDVTGGRSIIAICTTANVSTGIGTILTDAANWTFIFNGSNIAAANGITYSNATSGLISTNVQAAIDELAARGSARFDDMNILTDNGSFELWQRGAGNTASFAILASTAKYTADRWYLSTGVNQAYTVSAVAGLVTGSGFAAKIQRNAGQTGVGTVVFGYPLDIDECLRLRGNYISLTVTAKTGGNWSPASGTFSLNLVMGTGATIQKQVLGFTSQSSLGQNYSPAAGVTTTFNFNSVTTVPVNVSQAEVQLTWTPVGTAGLDDSITFDEASLIISNIPTSNVIYYRPSLHRMLLGCRRHFWKTFSYNTAPANAVGQATGELAGCAVASGAAAFVIWGRSPVSMRAQFPVMTPFNPVSANSTARDEQSNVDCSGANTIFTSSEGFTYTSTTNAATLAGNILGLHATHDAGI